MGGAPTCIRRPRPAPRLRAARVSGGTVSRVSHRNQSEPHTQQDGHTEVPQGRGEPRAALGFPRTLPVATASQARECPRSAHAPRRGWRLLSALPTLRPSPSCFFSFVVVSELNTESTKHMYRVSAEDTVEPRPLAVASAFGDALFPLQPGGPSPLSPASLRKHPLPRGVVATDVLICFCSEVVPQASSVCRVHPVSHILDGRYAE